MFASLPTKLDFFERFRTVCADARRTHNRIALFAALAHSFGDVGEMLSHSTTPPPTFVSLEGSFCAWVCFLLPFSIGGGNAEVRLAAANALASLVRLGFRCHIPKSPFPVGVSAARLNTNLAENFDRCTYDSRGLIDTIGNFLSANVTPIVRILSTNEHHRRDRAAGIDILCTSLMDQRLLGHKRAAAAILSLFLQYIRPHSGDGQTVTESKSTLREDAAHIADKLSQTIACIYAVHVGFDRYALAAPLLGGISHWVSHRFHFLDLSIRIASLCSFGLCCPVACRLRIVAERWSVFHHLTLLIQSATPVVLSCMSLRSSCKCL